MSILTDAERNKRLIDLLDEEFLKKLLEVGKLYGWQGDYHEIGCFIESLHSMKNMSPPNIDPYDIEYPQEL